jgi:mannose-6-phosphate isomerase-like protein (cupin superfamily)
MRIRRLSECSEFIAGDLTCLRELLHPDREYPFDGRYSLAHAVVAPGGKSRRHCLKTDEVYYILSGRGQMHVDDESAEVGPGDALEIPPGAVQWIENIGPDELAFLCIVDPAWRAEDEEVL